MNRARPLAGAVWIGLCLCACQAAPVLTDVPPAGAGATAAASVAPTPGATTGSAGSRLNVTGGGAGECVVDLSGAVTHRLVGRTDGTITRGQPGQAPAFLTRHWMSSAEVDLAATAQAGAIETARAQVATLIADSPPTDATAMWLQSERFLAETVAISPPLFSIECAAQDDPTVLIRILSLATTSEDLPLAPARYTVPLAEWSTDRLGGDTPGTFIATIGIAGDGAGGRDRAWVIAEPGRLEIERFDHTEVAGSFDLMARPMTVEQPGDGERRVRLIGRFAFHCPAGATCGQD